MAATTTATVTAIPAASSATATTSTPAIAATTTTTAAAGTGPLFHRAGFIHRELAPGELRVVQLGHGAAGFLCGSHFHETEAARFTGHSILHDVHGYDHARLGEMVLEVVLGGVEVDVADK